MALTARCHDCSKNYRVPHDRKEWRCKTCGGALEIIETEAAEVEVVGPCPACGAATSAGESFCGECGTPLDAAAESTAQQRDSRDRKAAAGEMRRVFAKLSRLKLFLTFNLWFSYLGGFGVLVLVLSRELELGTKVLIVTIQAVSIGLAFASVKYIERKPFPLVLSLAGLQTLSAIWSWYDGSHPWGPAIYAIILWLLAADAAQVTRLAKQYPDLYLARKMRGEHLPATARPGRTPLAAAARRAERKTQSKRALRHRVALACGVAVALLAAWLGYGALSAEDTGTTRAAVIAEDMPAPDAAIERFRAAWNAGDIPAMVVETKPSLQDKMRRSLERLGERYEWGARFPQLGEARYDEPEGGPERPTLRVFYTSEAGEFPVRFSLADGRWVVRTLTTSGLAEWRPK